MTEASDHLPKSTYEEISKHTATSTSSSLSIRDHLCHDWVLVDGGWEQARCQQPFAHMCVLALLTSFLLGDKAQHCHADVALNVGGHQLLGPLWHLCGGQRERLLSLGEYIRRWPTLISHRDQMLS